MATLLVGIVIAAGRHGAQLRAAKQKLAAVTAAEQLLAEWFSQPAGVPAEGTGTLPLDSTLVWETRILEDPEALRLGVTIVRLEIRRRAATTADDRTVLVTTDLAVAERSAVGGE